MRLCLFSSYFLADTLPVRVRWYLVELRRHFDRVVCLVNDDNDLSGDRAWFEQASIELLQVRNEGFDFGMWHKALATIDCTTLERLALVNDSCILFAPLDELLRWMDKSSHDVCGVTDSTQRAYHLQSYFLYFKQTALASVFRYFAEHGVIKTGFLDVIRAYEIGLSQSLVRAGYSLGARYSVQTSGFRGNPSMELVSHLLGAGMPMIKRKAFVIEPRLRYLRRQFAQVVNGSCPDPWLLVKRIEADHSLAPLDSNTLFGPLLAHGRAARLLNALWRWIYRLYSMLRPNRHMENFKPFS